MEFQMPEMGALSERFDLLLEKVTELANANSQSQEWFNLKDACQWKGVKYNTVKSKFKLQPNQGIPDGIVSGRRMWKRETVLRWLSLTDEDIVSTPGIRHFMN
jgi:hypothetical protein